MSKRFAVALLVGSSSVGCYSSALDTPNRDPVDPGSAGAGGEPGTGGTGSMVVCEPAPPVIDPTAIIDDMEDQNGSINYVSGRNGSWWTATDESPSGTFEPRQPIPELIPGSRCGSRYAMRVTGQGFVEWGSVLGMSLAYTSDGIAPHDASFRQGIRFWARIGDTSTRQVRFSIGDYHSAPEADWCVRDGTPACFTYDVDLVQIDTTWKHYVIPFGALVHPTPDEPNEPIDTTTLRTLAFYFHPSAVFDFWVDDLEFY
jgi:hypothetical protein